MDIKGKEYMLVNDRVKIFREKYPDGDIETRIISLDNGVVVIQADIYRNVFTTDDSEYNKEVRIQRVHLASGTAYEKEDSNFINKTSYIENCETSAVGRALGFLGIGIDTSIASAEEVQNAIVQQEGKNKINATQVKALQTSLKNKNYTNSDYEELLKKYNVSDLKDLTVEQYFEIINKLN